MSYRDHDDRLNCVCDVVNFINDLQDAAEEDENNCPTNCLNPVLGANTNNKHHHRKTHVHSFSLLKMVIHSKHSLNQMKVAMTAHVIRMAKRFMTKLISSVNQFSLESRMLKGAVQYYVY